MTEMNILHARLVDAGVPITGVGMIEDTTPRADYADNATAEQRAAGDAILAAFDRDLEIARSKKLEAVYNDFLVAGRAGYQVPGIGFYLAASTEDQNEFDKLQQAVLMYLAAGVWTVDSQIAVIDTMLIPRTLTVGQWQQVALGYTGFCLTLVNTMAATRAQVMAATTLEELGVPSFSGNLAAAMAALPSPP